MNAAEYEQFVAALYHAVTITERLTENLRTIKFDVRKKIRNKYGVEREFDVFWEYKLSGGIHRAVIECKNYQSRVAIDRIDALVGKLQDIEGHITPILATKTGFQSGAKLAAEHNHVELLIVREQDLSDWTDEEGNPLIRYVTIRMNFSTAADIHDFIPELDSTWVRSHTDIDTSHPLNLSGMNNELFIDDRNEGRYYSLHELASHLTAPSGKEYGRFKTREELCDAFFVHPKYGGLKML